MSRNRKRKSSIVWDYFDELVGEGLAKCKHCDETYCYDNASGSTGNLLKHLKSVHCHLDLSRSEESAATQPKMPTYYRRSVAMTPARAEKITQLIINVIVADMRPISLVEGEHFQKLILELAPDYDMPSRRSLTRAIEQKFRAIKTALVAELSSVRNAALTLDIWTSLTMNSYLGVTIHYIDVKFELKALVLATKEVNDHHTGDNIVAWLEAVLQDFNISTSVITAVTTDNGANMVKACRSLTDKYGWSHVRCVAHTLQLCVRHALDVRQIKIAIAAARRLVTFFRQTPCALHELRNRQIGEQGSKLELILDVSTRWNSTYDMLERLCTLQSHVRQILCDNAIVKPSSAATLELRDQHWATLQMLLGYLNQVKVTSDRLEGEYYVTISSVIPAVKSLHAAFRITDDDSVTISAFKATFLENLNERFSYAFTNDITSNDEGMCFFKSTLLDPRHKETYFDNNQLRMVQDFIESEISLLQQTATDHEIASESSSDAEELDAFTQLLKQGVVTGAGGNRARRPERERSNAKDEVQIYLDSKVTARVPVLSFWSQNNCDLPFLTKLMLKYHCIPATSASSERSFSSASLTANKLRSRLTSEHLENLNVLRCNRSMLD